MTCRDIPRPALQAEFLKQLVAKLDRGARDYGDESFTRPLGDTCQEILDELVDVAGWAFVSWVNVKLRLARVQNAVNKLANSDTTVSGAPRCDQWAHWAVDIGGAQRCVRQKGHQDPHADRYGQCWPVRRETPP